MSEGPSQITEAQAIIRPELGRLVAEAGAPPEYSKSWRSFYMGQEAVEADQELREKVDKLIVEGEGEDLISMQALADLHFSSDKKADVTAELVELAEVLGDSFPALLAAGAIRSIRAQREKLEKVELVNDSVNRNTSRNKDSSGGSGLEGVFDEVFENDNARDKWFKGTATRSVETRLDRYEGSGREITPEEMNILIRDLLTIDRFAGGYENATRTANRIATVTGFRNRMDLLTVKRIEGQQMSRMESFGRLAESVREKEGLNIEEASGFLRWFRDSEWQLLEENETRQVDIERFMRSSVGVFPVSIEQILEWLPSDFAESIKTSDGRGGQRGLTLEEFSERLKNEMKFLSVTHNRRVALRGVYGDLGEEIKVFKAFGSGVDSLVLDANHWQQVKDFLPEYVFEKGEDGRYDPSSGELLQGEWADKFKEAMARYHIMKRVWQDEAHLKFKAEKDARGNILRIVVLNGGFDFNKKGVVTSTDELGDLEASMQNPNLGINKDFGGNAHEMIAWLRKEGYVPNYSDGRQIPIDLMDRDDFNTLEQASESWLVPGARGRGAAKDLRDPGGEYGYTDASFRLANSTLDNLTAWGDGNIFFHHPTPNREESDAARRRLRLWVGGANPDGGGKNAGKHDKIFQAGRLQEWAANGLAYSGIAQYLDASGTGTPGLNLLMQTMRYFSGQRASGRMGPSMSLLRKIDRLAPTLFEMAKCEGLSMEEWFLRRGQRGNEVKYDDIPFERGNATPDKSFADSTFFWDMPFHVMRGDEHLEIGHIVGTEHGSSDLVINEEVKAKLWSLWKHLYLATAIGQIQNHEIGVLRNKEGGFDEMTPFELSKNLFVAILEEQLHHHYPNYNSPADGLYALLGAAPVAVSTEMKTSDEMALAQFLTHMMDREKTDIDGHLMFEGQVFTFKEAWKIIEHAGGGRKSALRRGVRNIIG